MSEPGEMQTPRSRLWADRGAARIVGAGGVAVVCSLVGILVFLIWEVLPLVGGAGVSPGRGLGIDVERPVATAADPYRTNVAVVDARGQIRVLRLEDGEEVAREALLPADAAVIGAGRLDGGALFSAAAADGRVAWAEVQWRIRYDGRVRVVTPRIAPPESLDLEIGDVRVRTWAIARDDDRMSVAAALSDGSLALARIDIEVNDFTGTRDVRVQRFRIADAPGVTHLAIEPEQRVLYAATAAGELRSYELQRGGAGPPRIERVDSPVTALALLIGGRALITGHADGTLAQWFHVALGEARIELARVRDFDPLGGRVRELEVSQRDRSFLARGEGGELALYHSTSGRRLWHDRLADPAPSALGFSPKGDAVFAVSDDRILELRLDSPHPEASLRTFVGRVWYEDYPGPAYVWQSTGGTDEFESKLSLVPLLVGTLKGTLYALLLAMPLGILGAIYVSQFMDPRLQASVKPTVEIMASLPSVVLGFVAGLWLAPRLEQLLPGLLLMALVLPLLGVMAGSGWRALPRAWTQRLPDGSEIGAHLVVLCLGGAVCIALSPVLEQLWFDGSVSTWLDRTTGLVYDQRNAIVAGIAMGFAVIPIILSLSDDALSNVPGSLSAASLALGATRWQTVARIVLPAASPGIFAAVMIGFGRAIGETMIVLMATGNTPILDWSAFNGFRTLSANIAVEIPEAPHGGTLYRTLFLSSVVLFALTFSLNTAAELVRERLRRRFAGQ